MAHAPVAISNLALGWLGKKPIVSFVDGTTESDLCAQNYPLSRDAVTTTAEWTFTTKRFVLVPDTVGPAYGDENRFLLPVEVLRVFTVNSDRVSYSSSEQTFTGVPWSIEGRYILTTEQQARIRAGVSIEDPQVFSSEFVRAIAARLAADIAVPLTGSAQIEDSMEKRYRMYLRDAKTQDGRQGTSKRLTSKWLERARWSGGGGGFFGPNV